METTERRYRAIFFDLDGTLLPMDLDAFLGDYMKALPEFVARKGLDSESFVAGLNAGIKAMVKNAGNVTNEEAFWETFYQFVDPASADWGSFLDEFYENEFGKLNASCGCDAAIAPAIRELKAKGYPLVVATMPLFPRRAVEWRLQWAGLDPADFARITTYCNSTLVKPKPGFCAENLAAAGLRGQDVLMVGNNTLEDMSFAGLGADMYLVTDDLLDPVNFPLDTVKHGTRQEFLEWVKALPACENPATDVRDAAIPRAERDATLEGNYRLDEQAEAAALKAFSNSYRKGKEA